MAAVTFKLIRLTSTIWYVNATNLMHNIQLHRQINKQVKKRSTRHNHTIKSHFHYY
ncbi:hypothetical protein THF1C08_500002 [Vibrio jasicida]|uniref:Uncharacterized protein n=1 Tax=Vibrio jasicida TaxID=766224 RepID=A0AAU9QV02_9VIBR|nr:hypothetical protein THF1C08_500002 [Vibrio jasicida]CAH1602026.1 hypothetical protein THF1A12_510019 [Vibrio jasicida]